MILNDELPFGTSIIDSDALQIEYWQTISIQFFQRQKDLV